MRFSLVLATVNRTEELARFLHYLDNQISPNVQLIVVDQNEDDRLVPLLAGRAPGIDVVHVRSRRGLSRARNVGLRHLDGDMVAFPDDDCWYDPDLLVRVAAFFSSQPSIDGVMGRIGDQDGVPPFGRCRRTPGEVTPANAFESGASASVFVRASLVRRIGGFDEELGVGAGTPWSAGEETDYVLRAIRSGARIWYDPALLVRHPQVPIRMTAGGMRHSRSDGRGAGRVMRRHAVPARTVLRSWIRPLGGAVLAAGTGQLARAQHHLALFMGRVAGWIG